MSQKKRGSAGSSAVGLTAPPGHQPVCVVFHCTEQQGILLKTDRNKIMPNKANTASENHLLVDKKKLNKKELPY